MNECKTLICGFNDAPRRAQNGDPLGIASLAGAYTRPHLCST
jgi:hypothetical protein